MSSHSNTDVLVVGAGPVGLLTAIQLAQAGVRVTIADQAQRPATHSYACGLHPSSLKLLARLGLLNDILAEARRIERVAFYSKERREAEVNLRSLPVEFPYVLVLPQSSLEKLLVQRFSQLGGEVLWHHRLSTVLSLKDEVHAEVDQLAGTSTGYIVPHWEWVVRRTNQITASFVVGADGQRSLVRRLLNIEHETASPPEFYVVYEFESGAPLPDEECVVLDQGAQSVLWPLHEGRCRWSFQLREVQTTEEFAAKDRSPVWAESMSVAERTLARLKTRLAERAPWFPGEVSKVDWAVDIQFQRRLARQLGQGRCWLVGDAAHQTSPGGIHSMNAGLLEAEDLARILTQILKKGDPLALLQDYDHAHRENWRRLLGTGTTPKPGPAAAPWVREHAGELVPSIPATGNDLEALLAQVGLALP